MDNLTLTGIIVALLTASQGHAERRIDYDIDDDGLIEINSLEDLNQIRYEYDQDAAFPLIRGSHLYGENSGCPEAGCNGYELTTNLSFDSNNNGEFDAGDSFWNDGKGFEPFGQLSPKFSAEFHGNGFAITHLLINYPDQQFVGLFSYNEMSYIHDLTLQATVTGGTNTGALLGHGWQTRVENIQAITEVTGNNDNAGGLIGILEEGSTVTNVIIQSKVNAPHRRGGLAGRLAGSSLSNIAIQTRISHDGDDSAPAWDSAGGLVGWSDDSQYRNIYSEISAEVSVHIGGVIGVSAGDTLSDILVTGNVINAAIGGGVVASDYSEGSDEVTLIRNISLLNANENIVKGGLIGSRSNAKIPQISHSYWATDLAQQETGVGNISSRYTSNAELTDLQCATTTSSCNGYQYSGFELAEDNLWDFGSNTEAPTIRLMNHSFGDKNGDGATDNAFPVNLPEPDTEPTPEPDPEPVNGSSSSSGGSIFWLLMLVPAGLIRRR